MSHFLPWMLILLFSSSVSETAVEPVETRGIYFFGHAISNFIPCGTAELWALNGDRPATTELREQYGELIDEEYGNLYIEAIGSFARVPQMTENVGYFEIFKLTKVSIGVEVIDACVVDLEIVKWGN